MILKKLNPNHPDIPALKKLFVEAFPEKERPISMDGILAYLDQIPCDLLGVYPEETPDEFSGFFFGIRGESSVYGVYFATRPDLRSTGIGSKAFKAVLEYYDDIPFWFSYESTFEESDNAEQRERRRRFYLKNGFYETGWFAKLNGTEFIIASSKKEFDKEAFEKFMGAMAASTSGAALPELYRRVKQTIILGNIITIDEKRPFAKAALVKDGVFAYIGSAEEAEKLAGADAQVLDYGENFIYPGFLEAHCHGHFAGDRFIGQANLTQVGLTDYDKYREIIKEFIAQNPQRKFYLAAGWVENDEYVSKAYLDEICSDKPLFLQTGGGHSMLLNTKALEWAGIDAAYAKKMGYDMVHVDNNGEPDGYICEKPVMEILPKFPTTLEDGKNYLLAWQDFAFQNGYTAVADAGTEIFFPKSPDAYHELEKEGRLKLRTYAYSLTSDNVADPKAEVARIAADRAKYSGEYFQIIGIKAFLDGVTEAHTGWQNQDYVDQPGYHGVERFNDHDKMVNLIVEADKEGLAVHVHSEGGGATHFMLGCIEDAEKITGDLDQRNVLAHLHFVTDEDVRRMAATGSIPAVPPLWTPEIIGGPYDQEVSYVGKELTEQAYPIKSFYDAGANVVFHSDYPISPMMNVKYSIYTAEKRTYPKEAFGDLFKPRNLKEATTREQSLRAMTINVARQFHQEHRLGSIEFGKIANMTVFDCDFLHDDIEKVAQANIIATIIDGEEVFKA